MQQLELEPEEQQQLRQLFARYQAKGFSVIELEYNGCGDSGSVDGICATDADVNGTLQDYEHYEALEGSDREVCADLFDSIIEKSGYSGFGDNEGGQGVVYLKLATGEVAVEHEWNVMEVETDSATLRLF